MGRNLDAKCKQCRRIGEKLFLKGDRCLTGKCAVLKRNYPPGYHGAKGKKRQSDYGLQLAEKQKAMKQYRLLEKQFRLTFVKAQKQAGNTAENLLRLLETRLDNTVYRLGLANSRDQARQYVSHGLIKVNKRMVSIPSYQVRTGDIISLKEKHQARKPFQSLAEKLKKYEAPGWLNVSPAEISGRVMHLPKSDDLKTNISAQMIVEFYSR